MKGIGKDKRKRKKKSKKKENKKNEEEERAKGDILNMQKPTTQFVLSITTIILFLAAIGIWVANGGIGRIREVGGSHAGGTGAYTETWTAEEIYSLGIVEGDSNLTRCQQEVPSAGRGVYTGRVYSRDSGTGRFTSPTVSGPSGTCVATSLVAGATPVSPVTKWTVTGHINP